MSRLTRAQVEAWANDDLPDDPQYGYTVKVVAQELLAAMDRETKLAEAMRREIELPVFRAWASKSRCVAALAKHDVAVLADSEADEQA